MFQSHRCLRRNTTEEEYLVKQRRNTKKTYKLQTSRKCSKTSESQRKGEAARIINHTFQQQTLSQNRLLLSTKKKERQKPNNESISCTMLMINNNEAWRNKRGEKISNLLSLKNHLQIRFGLAFALESGEGEGTNKTRETVPELGHHAVVNLARR
jgi:hypothetical protein